MSRNGLSKAENLNFAMCLSRTSNLLKPKHKHGFTLVEILIALAIIISVTALLIPVTIRFLHSRQLDAMANQVVIHMREARWEAIYGKTPALNGIKFFGNSYVRFSGVSYTARDQNFDELYPLGNVTAQGIDEIVFASTTGIPSVMGSFTLSNPIGSISVEINEQGLISFGAKTLQSL